MKESALIGEYPTHSSWIEVSKSAFINNVSIYRKLLESYILLGGVLKGNAYGHGFEQSLEILHDFLDIIFVINPLEGLNIRKFEKEKDLTQKRVIVIGAVSPNEAVLCAMKAIEVVISDESWAHYIPNLKKSEKERGNSYRPLKAHIHVDTGLSREGFLIEGIEHKIHFLTENQQLIHVQGVMSHFANTEDVTEQSYAFEQIAKLDKSFELITQKLALGYTLEKHIAQSSSTLVISKSHNDIVRVGIALYGLWPSSETKLSAKVVMPELPQFKPALSWKCKSQCVKNKIRLIYWLWLYLPRRERHCNCPLSGRVF